MSGAGQSTPARSPATLRRWRRLLAEEREAALLYRNLAARRDGEEREILLGLADAEERHAAYWERLLGEHVGAPLRARLRTRLLALLAGRLGWVFVLALIEQAERRARYSHPDVPASIKADELVHSEVVRGLAARGRAKLSGNLRASVFGINDGLVSNIALVLGVIGGGATGESVPLVGLAGLLAGALSMAAGEYISISSQRELLAESTPGEAARASLPELDIEANELALVYRARGMAADEAERRANAVLQRGQLEAPVSSQPFEGADVVGTELGAASSSFLAFAVGATIPVLPFLFGLTGAAGVLVSSVLTGLALMTIGAIVGVLSGGPPLWRALRQLAIGAGAAAATYLLGLAFSTTVA